MRFPGRGRNNLLIITFDQMRGDWVNPYNPVVEIPGLSRLAKDGWMATRCYTGSPQCVPARFSWLTGLEPSQLGVTKNVSVDLPADAPSIVRWIRNKGWHTEVVGKTHWTSHTEPGDLRDKKNIINELGFNGVLEVAGLRALKNISCELTDEWAMRDECTQLKLLI